MCTERATQGRAHVLYVWWLETSRKHCGEKRRKKKKEEKRLRLRENQMTFQQACSDDRTIQLESGLNVLDVAVIGAAGMMGSLISAELAL